MGLLDIVKTLKAFASVKAKEKNAIFMPYQGSKEGLRRLRVGLREPDVIVDIYLPILIETPGSDDQMIIVNYDALLTTIDNTIGQYGIDTVFSFRLNGLYLTINAHSPEAGWVASFSLRAYSSDLAYIDKTGLAPVNAGCSDIFSFMATTIPYGFRHFKDFRKSFPGLSGVKDFSMATEELSVIMDFDAASQREYYTAFTRWGFMQCVLPYYQVNSRRFLVHETLFLSMLSKDGFGNPIEFDQIQQCESVLAGNFLMINGAFCFDTPGTIEDGYDRSEDCVPVRIRTAVLSEEQKPDFKKFEKDFSDHTIEVDWQQMLASLKIACLFSDTENKTVHISFSFNDRSQSWFMNINAPGPETSEHQCRLSMPVHCLKPEPGYEFYINAHAFFWAVKSMEGNAEVACIKLMSNRISVFSEQSAMRAMIGKSFR